MPIEAVVADANVLLSCIVGKAAIRVLIDHQIAVHVTHFNAVEVEEYLPHFAEKFNIPLELVQLQWKLLPIKIHQMSEYKDEMPEALRKLAKIDPEDAHALALAKKMNLPLWSNDRHLQNRGASCLTTARFLKILDSEQQDEI